MPNTLHREPAVQPAAAIAAKDRATVEAVLQKVRGHQRHLFFTCTQSQAILLVLGFL